MELLTGPPAIQIGFRTSLPQDLFANLLLLNAAPYIEGLDDWVTRTAARLSSELAQEIRTLMGFLRYCPSLWGHLVMDFSEDHPAHESFPAYHALLSRWPAERYGWLALEGLQRELQRAGIPLSWPGDDPPAPDFLAAAVNELTQFRRQEHPGWAERVPDLEEVTVLFSNPAPLKRRLLKLLESFWAEAYAETYADCLPTMRRCVAYHRARRYPPPFASQFTAITGRTLPEGLQERLVAIRRVTFVPSCHIGPYFIFATVPPRMQISFNARTVAQVEAALDGQVVTLFPPLRALADETRLHILALLSGADGEMTTAEVMRRLGLSQSAASRHLGLLEKTGLIRSRKANGVKCYRLDPTRGREVLDALARLLNVA